MSSRVLRRRSATAAWIYAAVACGIAGSIVAARVFGLDDFGVFMTALVVVGFFQTLLDLTVEESLTKYGFRYVTGQDWGRLRRLFRQALLIKVVGRRPCDASRRRSRPLCRRDLRRRRPGAGASRGIAPPPRPVVRERRGDGTAPPQPLRLAERVPGGIGGAPPSRDRDRRSHGCDRGARRDRRRAGDLDDRDLGGRHRRAASVPVERPRRGSARTCGRSARSSSSRASRPASSRCARR